MLLECFESLRYERLQRDVGVALSNDNQNSDCEARYVLLIRYVLVNGNEHIEAVGGSLQ
ncbi:MAG: hypothetical protein QOH63_4073 [Acidobacteriota bacterium]|jgi:hypothetical protein|nr:hypothetical protein [Acidobacteriota bacterium]